MAWYVRQREPHLVRWSRKYPHPTRENAEAMADGYNEALDTDAFTVEEGGPDDFGVLEALADCYKVSENTG